MANCSCRQPELVPLTSYALDAVLAAAKESMPAPPPVRGPPAASRFVDGQPTDLEFVVSNISASAAVCLVTDNGAAIQQYAEVYAIEVSPLVSLRKQCIDQQTLHARGCMTQSWESWLRLCT